MNCARPVLYHGIWLQLIYFWTVKIQLGQAPFSFSDFHKPSGFFPDPHQVVLAPPNGSMVWLSCSFQTVGSAYYTIAATLRTHWGGNTPSVRHVGSNQMRVLTVTISRMKMLFTSGKLCPLCCPLQWLIVVQTQNMWIQSWTLEAATVKLEGWGSCHTWVSAALLSPQGWKPEA